jgi:hypothetical protein
VAPLCIVRRNRICGSKTVIFFEIVCWETLRQMTTEDV